MGRSTFISHQAAYPVCVPVVLSLSVKQPQRGKGDHSRPSSAEVNINGGIRPLPLRPNGVELE
jgi:hypothetical protein